MAQDFLSALVDWWSSNGALAAAGIPILHFNVAAGASYPYVTLQQSGGNVSHRNFTGSYVDIDRWTIKITSDSEDQVVSLGKVAMTALDTLLNAPLTFDNGQLLLFWRTGSNLVKARQQGTDGVPFPWFQSIFYMSKITRDYS